MLIKQFLNYLSKEKKYADLTLKAYAKDLYDLDTFLKHQQLTIDKATGQQIRRWLVSLSEQNLSERTINRKLAAIKSFYKFLQKTETLQINPTDGLTGLKIHRQLPLPFSLDEMEQLLDPELFKPGYEGIRDFTIIYLLYTTGLRRAELIGLKESDLDWVKKELKVTGKRNKQRLIPLLDKTLDVLKNYQQAKQKYFENRAVDDFLFLTKKSKKMYDVLVYRLINSYLSKVSVKHKRSPHMLRHTFATHLLNNGAGLNDIKELLGHSSLAATQIYTHSSIEQLKNVYKRSHPRNKN